MVSGLTDGRAIEQNMTIAPLQGQLMGALSPLNALQNLEARRLSATSLMRRP